MIGIEKYLLVKIKGIVTVKAGVEVEKAWYTDLPFLVHNVGEDGNRSAIACSDALVLHLDILLVVEGRIAFITVECFFIGLIDQITTGTMPFSFFSIVRYEPDLLPLKSNSQPFSFAVPRIFAFGHLVFICLTFRLLP